MKTKQTELSGVLPSIDFLPCPRYSLHHYSDMARPHFVHH